jgi:hypothetical protein
MRSVGKKTSCRRLRLPRRETMHDRVDIPSPNKGGSTSDPDRRRPGSGPPRWWPGVSVGTSYTGAGAVVLERPAYRTAAGVPAKTIRSQKERLSPCSEQDHVRSSWRAFLALADFAKTQVVGRFKRFIDRPHFQRPYK